MAVLAVAALLLSSTVAGQNLLVNGGFENEPNWGASNGTGCNGTAGCSALAGSELPGWTIEPGHAVTVHNNTIYPIITGTYAVNMDGEGANGHNANLYQDFATVSGQSYNLQYDWATWQNIGSPPNLDVTVTDTVTSAVLYHGSFAWIAGPHHVTTTFTGTGNPLRLRIQEIPESGVNDNAYIIDNFVVTAAAITPSGAVTAIPALDRELLAVLAAVLLVMVVVELRGSR